MIRSDHLPRHGEAATRRDPHGWRAGTIRVAANAVLVLLAYEGVYLAAGVAQMTVSGWTPPLPPVQFLLVASVFLLVRWVYVLPGLVVVLIGLEHVARHAPHRRFLTTIVALSPMVVWELLLKGPGNFPSVEGALLGVTAVVFGLVARLPARRAVRSTDGPGLRSRPSDQAPPGGGRLVC